MMLDEPRIYVDFQNVDKHSRLILSCVGTIRDLALHNIELKDGLVLTFYSDDADHEGNPDDLVVQGVAQFDKDLNHWTAIIGWQSIKHVSGIKGDEE